MAGTRTPNLDLELFDDPGEIFNFGRVNEVITTIDEQFGGEGGLPAVPPAPWGVAV